MIQYPRLNIGKSGYHSILMISVSVNAPLLMISYAVMAIWIESYNYIRCGVAYIVTFMPYVSSVD